VRKGAGIRALLADVAIGALVICAISLSLVTVWGRLVDKSPPGAFPRITTETNWAEYANGGNVLGPEDAAVTIVEFADFTCRLCGLFATYADSLEAIGLPVRLVYRHAPSRHPSALPAVRASQCGALQGRFEALHDALYAYQDSLGVASWEWFGRVAGVPDSIAYRECTGRSDPIPVLHEDSLAAKRLAVPGTPTLLIHELRSNGVPPLDSLIAYVQRAQRVAAEAAAPSKSLRR